MKIKTSELTGAALDWAVAKCENRLNHIRLNQFKQWEDLLLTQVHDDDYTYWNPSEDWAQGGPIIERECITVAIGDWDVDQTPIVQTWSARSLVCEIHAATNDGWLCGSTPLIAAMRCFVASKLGNEVEVPDELA